MSVYAFKPDPFSSHMQIGTIIKSLRLPPSSRVLDVGCSKGFIAKHLRSIPLQFFGIELDKKDASQARPYYQDIRICNLEIARPAYEKNFFGLILMADILEHLTDPLSALLHFKKSLSENGYLVMSTGNVANIWIRLNLLFGRFQYTDKGILDRTHTHLYTLKSFMELARKAGFRIHRVYVTPIPLPLLSPLFEKGRIFHALHTINYGLAILWKRLFGYQFILLCRNE